MISWKLRFFVPVTDDGPAILKKLMQRHRLLAVESRQ
jgi:Mn-dependent DtxR family transcriptional regulator